MFCRPVRGSVSTSSWPSFVTFNADIIETGTDSFRLRATKIRARRKPA
jgi:hypothetical protein